MQDMMFGSPSTQPQQPSPLLSRPDDMMGGGSGNSPLAFGPSSLRLQQQQQLFSGSASSLSSMSSSFSPGLHSPIWPPIFGSPLSSPLLPLNPSSSSSMLLSPGGVGGVCGPSPLSTSTSLMGPQQQQQQSSIPPFSALVEAANSPRMRNASVPSQQQSNIPNMVVAGNHPWSPPNGLLLDNTTSSSMMLCSTSSSTPTPSSTAFSSGGGAVSNAHLLSSSASAAPQPLFLQQVPPQQQQLYSPLVPASTSSSSNNQQQPQPPLSPLRHSSSDFQFVPLHISSGGGGQQSSNSHHLFSSSYASLISQQSLSSSPRGRSPLVVIPPSLSASAPPNASSQILLSTSSSSTPMDIQQTPPQPPAPRYPILLTSMGKTPGMQGQQQSSSALTSPSSSSMIINNNSKLFTLVQEPQEIQRKSYKNERRYLLPNPLVINWVGNADVQVSSALVEAFLCDQEGRQLSDDMQELLDGQKRKAMEDDNGSGSGGNVVMTGEDLKASFQLMMRTTSGDARFRIKFRIQYRLLGSEVLKCEQIWTRPFKVESNRKKTR